MQNIKISKKAKDLIEEVINDTGQVDYIHEYNGNLEKVEKRKQESIEKLEKYISYLEKKNKEYKNKISVKYIFVEGGIK